MQTLYKVKGWAHYTDHPPIVADNGVFAVRDMKEAGLYCHRTDTKQLWCIRQPDVPILNPAYPKLTEEEHTMMVTGDWPEEGRVPELERANSFHCWDHTPLAQQQDAYIADLRRRAL